MPSVIVFPDSDLKLQVKTWHGPAPTKHGFARADKVQCLNGEAILARNHTAESTAVSRAGVEIRQNTRLSSGNSVHGRLVLALKLGLKGKPLILEVVRGIARELGSQQRIMGAWKSGQWALGGGP